MLGEPDISTLSFSCCVSFLSAAAALDAGNQASTHELTIPNDVSLQSRSQQMSDPQTPDQQSSSLTFYHRSSPPPLLPS